LSGGAIFSIILFTLIFMAVAAFALVLWLNKEGYINIYLPKKLRVLCLKDYLSAEERLSKEHDEKMGNRLD
jgi:hypothetical protein